MSQPIAPRPGHAGADKAVNRANSGEVMSDSGLCLQCARQNFDVPSRYVSAIDAWNAAEHPHPGDRNPPVGVALWFDTASIYGHVVTHCGAGQIQSTFNAEIRLYSSIDQVAAVFGGPYMGWADDLNGYLTNVGSTPEPTPPTTPTGDDDMRVIYDPESYSYALVGGGYAYTIPNQEQADVAQKVWGPAVNVGSRYAWDLAKAMSLVGEDSTD